MNTVPIKVNDKPFTVREMTLDCYPECMAAFEDVRSKDHARVRDAILTLLALCSDVPMADAAKLGMTELKPVMDAITEVNGMTPKSRAEAVKADPPQPTLSGPSKESSAL